MFPIRIKACSESDLRMLGDLARNIQRVLPVTQADIDAAAALGKGWVVWKVIEVSDPINNLRGGTQLVIKQNSITPGQNVRRVLIVQGPGGQAVVVGPGISPLLLPDAIQANLLSLIAYGGTEQRSTPSQYQQVKYVTNISSTVLNTGIVFNFAKNYQMEIRCRAVSGSFYMFLSQKTQTGDSNVINGLSGSSSTLGINGNFNGTSITSGITRTVGNILYIKMTAINGTLTLYVKDETANTEDTVTGTYTVEDVNALSWIGLWGNEVASNRVDVNADVYMAKIIEDGVTVLDYVPCLNVATAGFYDKVSGTFKTTTGLSAALNPVPTPDAPIDIWCNNGMIKVRRKSGLPLEYRPVEYLMSTEAIDLGVRTTNNSVLEGKFIKTEASSQYLWQSDSGSSLTTNTTAYITSGSGNWRFGQRAASISIEVDTLYEARQNQNGVYLNDVKVASYTTVNEFTSVRTLKAFGTVSGNPVLKIYYITLRTLGDLTLEHNWIACERIADGVLGFYDIIGGTFHTNAEATITAGSYVADELELYVDGTQETIAIKDDNNTTISTAVAENLFAIDDYIDQQDVVTGNVTRKVKARILTGTESWVIATTDIYLFGLGDGLKPTESPQRFGIPCTHFVGTDQANPDMPDNSIKQGSFGVFANNGGVAIKMTSVGNITNFKQWLADQYAAGTPVIIVYVLKTEATEQVTAQTMSTVEGDNTAEITQASIDGLELKAEYEQGVQALVEEIEP